MNGLARNLYLSIEYGNFAQKSSSCPHCAECIDVVLCAYTQLFVLHSSGNWCEWTGFEPRQISIFKLPACVHVWVKWRDWMNAECNSMCAPRSAVIYVWIMIFVLLISLFAWEKIACEFYKHFSFNWMLSMHYFSNRFTRSVHLIHISLHLSLRQHISLVPYPSLHPCTHSVHQNTARAQKKEMLK